MDIGVRLMQARRNAGFTLRELAALLGVAHSTLGHWENNRSVPNARHLLKIAELTGVDAYVLLTGKPSKLNQTDGDSLPLPWASAWPERGAAPPAPPSCLAFPRAAFVPAARAAMRMALRHFVSPTDESVFSLVLSVSPLAPPSPAGPAAVGIVAPLLFSSRPTPFRATSAGGCMRGRCDSPAMRMRTPMRRRISGSASAQQQWAQPANARRATRANAAACGADPALISPRRVACGSAHRPRRSRSCSSPGARWRWW